MNDAAVDQVMKVVAVNQMMNVAVDQMIAAADYEVAATNRKDDVYEFIDA